MAERSLDSFRKKAVISKVHVLGTLVELNTGKDTAKKTPSVQLTSPAGFSGFGHSKGYLSLCFIVKFI